MDGSNRLQAEARRFARAATDFITWVQDPDVPREAADRALLSRLLQLVHTGLELPGVTLQEPAADLRHEWSPDLTSLRARLSLQLYSQVFDSTRVHGAEPVIGDLLDDVLDICRDLDRGLTLLEAGHTGEALLEWRLSFETHWGKHATAAIQALFDHLYFRGRCSSS